MTAEPPTDRIVWTTAIPRAAFLACSWTWCIGMWLPVILLREFGWMGFVAFTIPNIVGAAGMGLALRRPGAAERIAHRHARAIRAFVLATIAFHAFFLAWRVGAEFSWVHTAMLAAPPAILLLASLGLRRLSTGAWSILALITWLISIALVVAASQTSDAIGLVQRAGDSAPIGLLWLTPVMAFGFGACPFLDPTFLRIRRETPGRTGDAAFILGFGVLFLAMLALTALYAYGYISTRNVSFYILGHFLLQSIFTCGALSREIDARSLTFPILVGLAVAIIPYSTLTGSLGLRAEDIYRLFMGFYGLIFPAYAWIVMLPRRRPSGATTCLAAIILAAPCYWFGFVEQRWLWLAPGLAIVLLAPLVRGLLPRPAEA